MVWIRNECDRDKEKKEKLRGGGTWDNERFLTTFYFGCEIELAHHYSTFWPPMRFSFSIIFILLLSFFLSAGINF